MSSYTLTSFRLLLCVTMSTQKGDDSDDITAAITSAGSGCVAISCKPQNAKNS